MGVEICEEMEQANAIHCENSDNFSEHYSHMKSGHS